MAYIVKHSIHVQQGKKGNIKFPLVRYVIPFQEILCMSVHEFPCKLEGKMCPLVRHHHTGTTEVIIFTTLVDYKILTLPAFQPRDL